MKFSKRNIFSSLLIPVVIALLGFGFQKINQWGVINIEEDGLIEEMVEDLIQHHTGLSIDLSPDSEEI